MERRQRGKWWRRIQIGWMIFFTLLVAIALDQAHQQRKDLRQQTLSQCLEIEQLKTGGRVAAWRDFNNLNQTLKVLKIEKTPEIVETAINNRDRRLLQFKKEKCPREITP